MKSLTTLVYGWIAVITLGSMTIAQNPTSNTESHVGNLSVPAIALTETKRTIIPMGGAAENHGVGLPIYCSDDTLFLRVITQTAVLDVVSITTNGKVVTHYDRKKITDLPNSEIGSLFVTGNDIYIEAERTSEPIATTVTIPGRDGTTKQEKTIRYKSAKTYLAHFKSDGTYVSAIPLELEFDMIRFGVFRTGEILATGLKYPTGARKAEPVVALLSSSGQLLRYLEFEGDIQRESPQFSDAQKQDTSPLMPAATFLRVITSSMIVPSGDNLVLVRPGSTPRVFEVNAGGGVVRKKLDIPARYSLQSLISAPAGWVAQVIERLGPGGIGFHLFSIDRDTGAISSEYHYPGPFGLGLACTNGKEFLFLQEQTHQSFTIVSAEPSLAGRKDTR